MKNYPSKFFSFFLCITFLLHILVIKTEPEPGWYDRLPKKTVLVVSVIALGIGKYIHSYFENRSVVRQMQERLESVSGRADDRNFSFQTYRINDVYSDEKCWLTAHDILENKKEVIKALEEDIQQGDRIYINGKACNISGADISEKKIYETIKEGINQEIGALRRSIAYLTQYTDAKNIILNLVNTKYSDGSKGNSIKIIFSENILDQYYTVFSKLTNVNEFKDDLMQQIQNNNTSYWNVTWYWKRYVCPYYIILSSQYWQYVQRYVRVCALKNVIDEKYNELGSNVITTEGDDDTN